MKGRAVLLTCAPGPLRLPHTAGQDQAALRAPMICSPTRPIAYTERLGRGNAQCVPRAEPLLGRAGTALAGTVACRNENTRITIEILLTEPSAAVVRRRSVFYVPHR